MRPTRAGGLVRGQGCIISIRQQRSLAMDFIRRLQPKDWTIALVAFIAGAWIF
jgi:hypothetical protein